jgi:hypothetical protein
MLLQNLTEISEEYWEIWLDSVDWVHLAHDRDLWWALVNMVMNLRGSIKGG